MNVHVFNEVVRVVLMLRWGLTYTALACQAHTLVKSFIVRIGYDTLTVCDGICCIPFHPIKRYTACASGRE